MKLRALIVVLTLLVAVGGAATYTAAAVGIQERPTLVIVIDKADFYPYYYREHGKPVGPMPEVTEAVLLAMGYSVEFLEVPWARAVDMVTRLQADAITGIFYRQEREAFLHYPQHFPAESLLSLMVRADSSMTFDGDFSVVEGHDIGAVLGWTYGLFRKPLEIGRIDVGDERVLVRNVALGRIDIGIGNPTSLAKYAVDQGLRDRIRLLEPPVERTPLFTAFSKKPGHDGMARRFSAALEGFKDTKSYSEIMHRHGID